MTQVHFSFRLFFVCGRGGVFVGFFLGGWGGGVGGGGGGSVSGSSYTCTQQDKARGGEHNQP